MNLLAVPYFKQDTVYTCGPASLKMAFAHFGVEVSEDELVPLLGTNDAFGTEREKMSDVVKSFGLIPFERTDATIDDVRRLVSRGVPVILRFLEEQDNTDHYGVAIGIGEEEIVLHDPWVGANISYELGRFVIRWPCTYRRGQTCWMLGIGDQKIKHE